MYQCQLGRSQPKEKGCLAWTSAALVMTAEMSDIEFVKCFIRAGFPFVLILPSINRVIFEQIVSFCTQMQTNSN